MAHPSTKSRQGPRSKKARSDCWVARSLDIVGDRWTLLVIRDMLFAAKRRYGDFLDSAEGITTNILAERLKRLEREGLVKKVLYSEHPPRWEYHLTPKGKALEPAIRALFDWGKQHLG